MRKRMPCEVQVYTKAPGQVRNCEKQILSETTLNNINERTIVYSTPKPQEITIKYENEVENKIILNKIGKSSVSRKCKITTPHVTLRTQKAIKAKVIQAYLSKFNLTLDYKSNKEIKNKIKIVEKTQQIIKDPLKLTKLSLNIEEISKSIEN